MLQLTLTASPSPVYTPGPVTALQSNTTGLLFDLKHSFEFPEGEQYKRNALSLPNNPVIQVCVWVYIVFSLVIRVSSDGKPTKLSPTVSLSLSCTKSNFHSSGKLDCGFRQLSCVDDTYLHLIFFK